MQVTSKGVLCIPQKILFSPLFSNESHISDISQLWNSMTVSQRCSIDTIFDLYEEEYISTNWINMHIAPKKIFYELSVNSQIGQNAHLKLKNLWSRSKTEFICECLGFIERAWSLCRWWGGRQYFSGGSFTKKNPPVSLDIFSDAVSLYWE